MVNKPPAFQFYPSDFLSDENVVLMNNQEVAVMSSSFVFVGNKGRSRAMWKK